MHYHVILTKECNLKCEYCGGGSDSQPREIQYSIDDLKKFISHDKKPILEFYGGEPLLRIETMKKIMDSLPGKFVIQTNGLLLDKLESHYLKKFHSILISIDGNKDITDRARGKGVYERIMNNLKIIGRGEFRGDLVARMTVAQGTDIYENVLYLLTLKDPGFNHVHWQLDFEMFWEAWEHTIPGLLEWIDSYNSGITSLVRWWVLQMERTGRVPGIVPFIAVMNSFLNGIDSHLRCGSGIDFFTIMPDGRISACPVSIDFDFSVIGSIYKNVPSSLIGKARVGEPCTSCDIFRICGGRCLFVNRSQDLLRENGYTFICSTVRHLVKELHDQIPRIRMFIERGIILKEDFAYPEFNNGCEVIP
jgi:uncharacterized protein